MTAKRRSGHALTTEWNRERQRDERATTGTCRCGWKAGGSTRAVIRAEYRNHLLLLHGAEHGTEDEMGKRAKTDMTTPEGMLSAVRVASATVHEAEKLLDDAKRKRDEMIRTANVGGIGYRRIAEASGMSHMGVKRITLVET